MAHYLRGHPDHPKEIKDGTLVHDGSGGLRFRKAVQAAMALPGQPKPPSRDVLIELAGDELRPLSVGAPRKAASVALGGLAPVGDDLLVGLGGVVGGGETGFISCLIERGGERHVVFFWADAGAARLLADELNRERIALGQRPLPRIEEFDAADEASGRAERRDKQLDRVIELLEANNALLERVARGLEGDRR